MLFGTASKQFFRDALLQFAEWRCDQLFHQIPLRFFGVSSEVTANIAGSIADLCRFGSQLGIVDHFFNVAEAVGPIAKTVTGQRSGCGIPGGKTVQQTSLAALGTSRSFPFLFGRGWLLTCLPRLTRLTRGSLLAR